MDEIQGLIALDLDGTLLVDEKRISPFCQGVLASLAEKGYMVVLCSGRPPRSMARLYEQASCFGPIICYNGAKVFHPKDASFPVLDLSFHPKFIAHVYETLSPYLHSFMAEGDTEIYLDHLDPELTKYYWVGGMKTVSAKEGIKERCYTCLFGCDEAGDAKLQEFVKPYKELTWRHWTSVPYSQFYYALATKGNGLKHILKTYAIPKEKIWAFGDADNDLSLLQEAGHGYCIKGCKSTVLPQFFPYTEKSNQEDGIAYELEKLFLK